MLNLKTLFLTTIILELLHLGESYITTIDAREEECFFERGPKLSEFEFFKSVIILVTFFILFLPPPINSKV